MARGLDDDEASRELYSIPLSSNWFQWDRIDEVERRQLPEFFDGSSPARNPRVYKEYRDFIINKYREDVSRRLKFTEIRKSLIGDVSALRRVFLFLDKWGLINFSANPEEKIGGGDGGVARVRVVIEEALPPGLQVVSTPLEAATVKVGGDGGSRSSGVGRSRLPPLTSYSDVFGEWAPDKGSICISCGGYGQDGSIKGKYFTCKNCLENNNTNGSRSKDDPKSDVRIENHVDHASSAWTDTETLLLLEGVLKHGDDWDLVAQHVRTKSKLDCIARLIQLPFGDHLLGVANGKYGDTNSNIHGHDANTIEHEDDKVTQESIQIDMEQENSDHEKPEGESQPSRLPKRSRVSCFKDMTSSLMQQVALLSTATGPYVASAAADAAVTAICNEIPSAKAAFVTDENANIESTAASNVKANDRDLQELELPACDEADQPDSVPEKNFTAMAFQIRAATATALGSVAAHAKLLAQQEDREIEHQMATIIEMQLKKINYKMKHFEELTSIMEKDYECIQQQKELILSEWVCVLQRAFKAGIPRWREIDFPKSFLLSIL